MKRIIALLLGVASSFGLILALAGPAAAAGPYNVATQNGNNYYIAAATLTSGTNITQDTVGNARNLTFTATGDTCTPDSGYTSCVVVKIQFYNASWVAATNNCDGNVVVKTDPSPTGNVWYEEQNGAGGYFELRNQHCIGSGSYLYADNVRFDAWLLDGGGTGGHYYKLQAFAA